eukprot:CCRYP_013185-RB/>CCRYP_013185-RB protein AED:0.09 eAED:0.09 QI:289/0.87/0.88/1/1/0.88/9/382/644
MFETRYTTGSKNRAQRLLLLALSPSIGTFAEAGNGTSTGAHYARMLPTGLQNMCGSSYSDALGCGTPCPGGVNEECPAGQMCFAEIECPLPPTISPAPTRSPVKGYAIGKHDKQIIASWQWYDRSKLAKPESMDFRKVTRVNFAFFQTDTAGNIWGTDDWADPRVLFGDVNLNAGTCGEGTPGCRCSWVKPEVKSCSYHIEGMGLISRVHAAGKEIWPSIGGWTLSDAFPAMAKNPASRAKFAENCVGLIKDYGFDGIDIGRCKCLLIYLLLPHTQSSDVVIGLKLSLRCKDWEYPGFADHSGTPDDTESYNLLLQELRNTLDNLEQETGKHYGITAALPCGPNHIANIDVPTVSNILSELNLMTYDLHGAWDPVTGVNSPLYDGRNDPEPGWSIDGCAKNWVEKGAPKDKLNIGLAFYGRSFKDAKALGELHGGTDDINWAVDEGTPQFFNIMDKISQMTYVMDEESKTPYAYFDQGGLVSYDDESSICYKTEYAMNEQLNGVIMWELTGDVMKDLNTPLLDILNRKLVETTIDCANPFQPVDTQTMSASATAAKDPASASVAETTISTTEATSQTTEMATTKATEATMAEASEGTAIDTTTSSTVLPPDQQQAQIFPERKPVKRHDKKPDKPYRPPKEELEL